MTVTTDPDEITTAVNGLSIGGGWEKGLIAIYNSLQVSTKRSVLFHITDDRADDWYIEKQVIALAIIRKIRVSEWELACFLATAERPQNPQNTQKTFFRP